VHRQLDQRRVAEAGEAVHLTCLDHEDVPRPGLEFHAVHRPAAVALLDELDFVVGVAVGTWALAGEPSVEEDRDSSVALIGSNEVVRAALERQVLLADAVHDGGAPLGLEMRS
jgi:hypothetical protein